jgi:mutual gliding-motility protein MglA
VGASDTLPEVMVLFNYATKEITAKIVYYGPGLCGKTTNLQFVYDSLPSTSKSKMLSLATKTDRTLFFDFLPLDLGKIRGMRTKLQLYTVPGQVYYNSTRQLVLKGADGVVFVADSQDFAIDANLESLQNLEDNLKKQGVRIREIPLVIQYNKRDLPNALPVDELGREINHLGVRTFESVATTGLGVEDTLKGITQVVLSHLVKKYGLESGGPLEKEIHVLDANTGGEEAAVSEESVWEDTRTEVSGSQPEGALDSFTVDDSADQMAPLVETELVASTAGWSSPSAFRELSEDELDPEDSTTEVPLASVEIPLPAGLLSSLPRLDAQAERRQVDGLTRDVTIPLNLSLDEIRRHRKLRLNISLDINLLP